MAKMAVYKYSSEDMFNLNKERYNAFQSGNGVVRSAYDKARDRNSKSSKRIKYELKQFCY